MADDRLRISAEVTDGFTGPLGKMQGALRGVQQTGQQAGAALKKDFEGAHGAIGKTTGALQQMTPVLTSFGVGAFGAVASITGMASALKNFTGNTQALAMFSKETGISIDKLRAFGELGERFGVSTSAMQGAVKSLSSNMYEVRRRWGEAYSSLQKMNLGGLAEQLVSAPNMDEALKRAMEGLGKIPDPEVRRRVSRMLFGTDDIAAVAGELGNQFEATLADIARRMGRTTEQQVAQAKQFEKSLSELRANLDGLRHEALTPLVTELNEMVKALQSPEAMKAFNNFLGKIGETARTTKQEFEAIVAAWGKIKDFFGGDPSQNRLFTPGLDGGHLEPKGSLDASKLQGRKSSIEQQLQLLDRNPGAADYARKRDRMVEELKRVGDELQSLREKGGNATVQPQSFQGGGLGGLIQKAGYGGAPILWGGGAGGGALGGSLGGALGSGGAGGLGTSALPVGGGSGVGHIASQEERAAYIRQAARARGIDSEVALMVAQSEGFGRYVGDKGTSFGDFQLHYKNNIPGLSNGGLGDVFTKRTGLNARDPNTWKQQTDFALDEAKKSGWGAWHGAAGVGISRWQGLRGGPLGNAGGNGEITDLSGRSAFHGGALSDIRGFVFHHTAGRGTAEGVINTLNQRGLGVQYVMGRDGRIYRTLPRGARGAHILPSRGTGLSNANTMGMEVIAKDDSDVTPEQTAAAQKFIAGLREQYPGLPVFGHGEVNPGHKQATEGMTIVNAIRRAGEASAGRMDSGPGGNRMGDAAMRRLYGGEAPVARGPMRGSLDINLNGFPAGAQARASMDDIFQNVKVSKSRQMDAESI